MSLNSETRMLRCFYTSKHPDLLAFAVDQRWQNSPVSVINVSMGKKVITTLFPDPAVGSCMSMFYMAFLGVVMIKLNSS